MLNSKEAQKLVQQYENKRKMEQLKRVGEYLDAVGVKIHNASLCGIHHVTVAKMENFDDNRIAVDNIETLGYEISTRETSDYLTICW